jgi:hypothetical protein
VANTPAFEPPVVLDGREMQRPTESCSPALSGHLRPADDEVERHEHVLARQRSVLERHVEREVPAADRETGRVARDQRAGDADVRLVTQQLVGVEHAECEADDGRDRRERDVALREVEPEADDLAALPLPPAHDARVRQRRGIGARARMREREARHLFAAREAR